MDEQKLMDLPLWNDPITKEQFKKICTEEGILPSQIGELISILREHQHMDRARGIYDEMDSCLSQGDEPCE